jgi:tape measure domain-containing protein
MPTADEVVTKYTLDPSGYVRGAKKVEQATRDTARSIGGFQSLGGGFKGMGSGIVGGFASLIPVLGKVFDLVKRIAGLAAAGAGAIAGLGLAAMKVAADFDAMKRGLAAVSGSMEEAQRQMNRLETVAKLPGLGFSEAVEGAIKLQAAGMDFRLAERSLMAFGNALAQAAGTKEDLFGVVLALSQIATKSKVSAEEINQIAERVPQIRQAMLSAFGTADTEALSKQGIGPQQFITAIIAELEKLPQATGGARNSFENFGDTVKRVLKSIGDTLNAFLLPMFDRLVGYLEKLNQSRVFATIAQNALLGPRNAQGFRPIMHTMGANATSSDPVAMFVSQAVATLEVIPDLMRLAVDVLVDAVDNLGKFVTTVMGAFNAVIGLVNKLPGVDLKKMDTASLVFNKEDHQTRLREILSRRNKRAGDIMGILSMPDEPGAASDAGIGSFRNSPGADLLQQVADNTAAIAEHTKPLYDAGRHIVGGGDLARMGVSPVERGKSYGSDDVGKVLSALERLLRSGLTGGDIVAARRQGAF